MESKQYIVRYMDGEEFDRYADQTEAVLWAVMIDGTWERAGEED